MIKKTSAAQHKSHAHHIIATTAHLKNDIKNTRSTSERGAAAALTVSRPRTLRRSLVGLCLALAARGLCFPLTVSAPRAH